MVMETQYLAGNNAEALAAADRLLAIEPNHARALATKGLIQVRRARRGARRPTRRPGRRARQSLRRAVSAAPNDPVVLDAYYDSSFDAGGAAAGGRAERALYGDGAGAERRRVCATARPRFRAARGMIPEAIAIIRPDAYPTPHRRNESEGERREREEREDRYRQAGPRPPRNRARNADPAGGAARQRRPDEHRRQRVYASESSRRLPPSRCEQPRLALQAVGIAAGRAVGADDAVAGDQHRDIVGAVGRAGGAHRGRAGRPRRRSAA